MIRSCDARHAIERLSPVHDVILDEMLLPQIAQDPVGRSWCRDARRLDDRLPQLVRMELGRARDPLPAERDDRGGDARAHAPQLLALREDLDLRGGHLPNRAM